MAKASGSGGGNRAGGGVRADYRRYIRQGRTAGDWWKPMPFSRFAELDKREKELAEAMNRGMANYG